MVERRPEVVQTVSDHRRGTVGYWSEPFDPRSITDAFRILLYEDDPIGVWPNESMLLRAYANEMFLRTFKFHPNPAQAVAHKPALSSRPLTPPRDCSSQSETSG